MDQTCLGYSGGQFRTTEGLESHYLGCDIAPPLKTHFYVGHKSNKYECNYD